MSEHSKGPWELRFGGSSGTSEGFCIASKGDNELVAEFWPPIPHGHIGANARLIVAAPDLLAALKALANACSKRHWEGTTLDTNLIADAIDAVKKAEAPQ